MSNGTSQAQRSPVPNATRVWTGTPAPGGAWQPDGVNPTLRVASFNIRNGRAVDGLQSWPFRRRATASVITQLGADVLGLQEVFSFQQRWLMRQLSGYEAYSAGRTDGERGERCPVLVHSDVARIAEATTRWYGDAPTTPGTRLPGAGFPRLAALTRIELQNDPVTIMVVNTHLDERHAANRRRSVEQLIEWIDVDAGIPTIVLGDFNADAGACDTPLDLFAAAHMRSALGPGAGGTAHSFTGRTDGPQLDHIFVSEHWEVRSACIVRTKPGRRWPSDHWPVVADLELTAR